MKKRPLKRHFGEEKGERIKERNGANTQTLITWNTKTHGHSNR